AWSGRGLKTSPESIRVYGEQNLLAKSFYRLWDGNKAALVALNLLNVAVAVDFLRARRVDAVRAFGLIRIPNDCQLITLGHIKNNARNISLVSIGRINNLERSLQSAVIGCNGSR